MSIIYFAYLFLIFHRKFISEVLGYQFYRALCQKIDHRGQLHNCDFFGNFVVGNSLK